MAGEADRLIDAGAKINGFRAHEIQSNESWVGLPDRISSDPAEVSPDADLIILSIPAFALEPVLKSIGAYVSNQTCLGAIPSSAALDVIIKKILGQEYLIANQVKGQDIGETRAPQRFGYHEIHAFVQDMGYL